MATIHRDGDLDLLDGKVAVVGFGSQGHAHALNLRDSGVDVAVGLREGSGSRARPRRRASRSASIADAVRGAQLVAILVPDHVQKEVWDAEVAPNLEPGAAVLFAHGLNIHFGRIAPPDGHDVIMVAPKAPGHRVRELYVSGAGTPGLVAIHQDASGSALALALAYGVGIGCGRVGLLETTFAEETESDLFGEQAVLCGGVPALVQAGFDTLVAAGYQPEIAYYECLNELKLIVDLLYQGGYEYMRYSVSDVAEYGDLSRGTRVVDDGTRERMRGDPRGDPERRVREGALRRRRGRTAALRRAARAGRRAGRRRSSGSARSCASSPASKGCSARRHMASVDVGVALLGYGTVGASVSRMLAESGDEIERATGHRLRVVRALVQDPAKERSFPAADGVLTTDFAAIRDDPAIDVVAEVMGGLEPAGGYVRALLARRASRSSPRTSS